MHLQLLMRICCSLQQCVAKIGIFEDRRRLRDFQEPRAEFLTPALGLQVEKKLDV